MEEMKKIKVIVKNSESTNYILRDLDRLRSKHNMLVDDFYDLVKKHNLLCLAWGLGVVGLAYWISSLDRKLNEFKLEKEKKIMVLNAEVLELRKRVSHIECEEGVDEE